MSRFSPANLNNPDIVRTIELNRLLKLVRPHAKYFDGRGLTLPSTGTATAIDIDLLAEIIESPDDNAPQELLNALGYIDAMATPAGMDALLPAAIAAGMPFDSGLDQTPADIAVQVWLFDPTIVEDQHAWFTWKPPRRADCFQPAAGVQKRLLALTPDHINRGQADISNWLGGNNRSSFCKLSIRKVKGGIEASIQRGEPFERKQTIKGNTIQNLHYRPAGKDTVVFKEEDHVLQCSSSIKRLLPIYQRVFGILLFDDPEYFSDGNRFTLAPLADLGKQALVWGELSTIEAILLTQYRVHRGGRNAYAVIGADDIFADLKDRGEDLKIDGQLIDVTFKIKFRGTKAWRTVKLYSGSGACYTRDSNADIAEQWLKLKAFIKRSGVTVETEVVEVDDDTLASV